MFHRRQDFPSSLRRLAIRVGLPLLAVGLEQGVLALGLHPHSTVAACAAADSLPPGKTEDTAAAPVSKPVSIGLDAVLHLTESQNRNIAKARAKVEEAEAQADLARKKCLPSMKATYNKVAAEQNAWQQKAELSKLVSETVLDASTTYIDLVTARAGWVIAESLRRDLEDLHSRAAKLAQTEPTARVEVARIQAEIEARKANLGHFQAQAAAASAKLVYLLGMDPCTELVPVDTRLLPIDLIDAATPTCDLVAKALTQGPGIRELEVIVGLIEEAIQRLQSHCLTNCMMTGERRRIAEAQRTQAHFAYDDLRAKLTAGVREAQATIAEGAEEIRRAGQQVNHAAEARKLSKERLENTVMGSSPSEVLLGLQSLGSARINHMSAIRDYNKAQLRLLILTGGPAQPAPQLPLPPNQAQ